MFFFLNKILLWPQNATVSCIITQVLPCNQCLDPLSIYPNSDSSNLVDPCLYHLAPHRRASPHCASSTNTPPPLAVASLTAGRVYQFAVVASTALSVYVAFCASGLESPTLVGLINTSWVLSTFASPLGYEREEYHVHFTMVTVVCAPNTNHHLNVHSKHCRPA